MKLDWLRRDDLGGVVRFKDARIHVCLPEAAKGQPHSNYDFLVLKTPGMVDRMAQLADELRPKTVFELGIFTGGSVVLYSELFAPSRLIAIDIAPETMPNLGHYVRRRHDRAISLHLGVNQADRPRLAEICARDLAGEPLDLVIDDASHFLFETRESFRELFPRLRPGGAYIIEDWGWSHWPGDHWQREAGGGYFRGKESMSNLVMELVVLAASKPEWIARVAIESATVHVTRGPGEIEPGFDLSAHCLNGGQPLPRFA